MAREYETQREAVRPRTLRMLQYLSLLFGVRVDYDCGGCNRSNSGIVEVKDLPKVRCDSCGAENRLPLITPPPERGS
ncbi:hypothetical protein J4233_03650 [Candidatus Pacearchaeota archaeon]|nr:hypothetical protein [Candidatus Pacearchaeota archaeon]